MVFLFFFIKKKKPTKCANEAGKSKRQRLTPMTQQHPVRQRDQGLWALISATYGPLSVLTSPSGEATGSSLVTITEGHAESDKQRVSWEDKETTVAINLEMSPTGSSHTSAHDHLTCREILSEMASNSFRIQSGHQVSNSSLVAGRNSKQRE